jgi:6-phosphogluconolactonase
MDFVSHQSIEAHPDISARRRSADIPVRGNVGTRKGLEHERNRDTFGVAAGRNVRAPAAVSTCARHLASALIWLILASRHDCISMMAGEATNSDKPLLVYIGTYSGHKSQGIHLARFNPDGGTLSSPELAVETINPTFLALHPNRRVLYAANEVNDFGGKKAGAISAFGLDGTSGKLTFLNQQSSGGPGPCHLSVDATGKYVLVANYAGGSIAALPLEADGKLEPPSAFVQHEGSSVNPDRQSAPHAHFITTDPANQFALACDLGLDKILLYHFNPSSESVLTPNNPPAVPIKPGSGPRHLAFHPNGRFLYLINELSGSMTVFSYSTHGARAHQETGAVLIELQTISTLPDNFSGENLAAEVELHPSGKFVYGSNRGQNSIVVYRVDSATGKLSYVAREPTPGKSRHFALDPSGRWLLAALQDKDKVVVFRVDPDTGRLSTTSQSLEVGAPVCVQFVVGT